MNLRTLLHWISRRRPVRYIDGPDGQPYLERYFLFHLPVLDITGYLHRFVDSDPDRGLHDHPWGWACALVLTGGYLERRLVSVDRANGLLSIVENYHKPCRLNIIRGDDFHRVILPGNREAWTLFVHGKRTKGWGFLKTGGGAIKHQGKIISRREWFDTYEPYAINRAWDKQNWWQQKTEDRRN